MKIRGAAPLRSHVAEWIWLKFAQDLDIADVRTTDPYADHVACPLQVLDREMDDTLCTLP